MDRFGVKYETETLFKSIRSENNNIREYFLTKLQHLSANTQINHLTAIKYLFENTGKNDGREINKEDILNLLDSNWYNSLKNSSRKIILHNIRMCIKFCFSDKKEETELVKMLKDKVSELIIKSRELNKEDLISREDLNIILKNVSLKLQALIMVLFEGALRKGELLNIRLKDIRFEDMKAKINVKISKSRNGTHKAKIISFYESVPYLKQWIDKNNFKPDDYIFEYKHKGSLNGVLIDINKRLQRLYPDKWKHKKIYPHLARHSRITELYSNGHFNDELMRKFAGWEPGSPMAKVYSHLVDSDVDDALNKSWGIEKPEKEDKSKIIKPIICPYCNNVNNQENIFCWKCNNILDETKRAEAGIQLIKQDVEINKVVDELANIKSLLKGLSKIILTDYYSKMEVVNNKRYRDLKEQGKIVDIGFNNKTFLKYEELVNKMFLNE